MSIVHDVLVEDLEYSIEREKFFQEKYQELPAGCLAPKKINGHIYYYLARRENGKVKTEYLGKLSDEEIEEYEKKIARRKKYKEAVKQIQKEIKYLRRLLRVKPD